MKFFIKNLVITISLLLINHQLIGQSCDGDNLNLYNMTDGVQHAKISITSSGIIENGENVTLKAGTSITLTSGFYAKSGSQFTATIAECTSGGSVVAEACTAPNTSIWNNPWLSCQTTANPNPSRGNSHWIRYDLGSNYNLGKMQVWNVNKVGESTKGFKDVIIDYSLNGSTWTQLGTFQFPQGTEAAIYSGFESADFGGISARYVLITSLSNWGDGNCAGLSDIKFNIAPTFLQDMSAMLTARKAMTDSYLSIGATSNKEESLILVYPNPASLTTAVVLESSQSMPATILIRSLMGNIVKSIDIEIIKGQNGWSLSLATIPSGTYFVDVQTKMKNYFKTQKLVVVRE